MQLYLLQHAGLTIAPALPDLLRYELRLTAIFILPFVAIAAVTSTFARLLLTLIVALLYLVGVIMLGGSLFHQRMTPPHLFAACLILTSIAAAAVLLLQYATRRTRTSRIALLATPVVLLILTLAAPARTLINRAYTAAPNTPLPTLTFDPDPLRQEPGSGAPMRFDDDAVALSLPSSRPVFPAASVINPRASPSS